MIFDPSDDAGQAYNIEIQRADKGADRKRARYHAGMLDAHLLKPGQDFGSLPETFVIFITEHDVIGKGKPLYRVERIIEETREPFNDGEHIVYVNGADKNATTALGKLMHDFFCTDPDDMHDWELAEKVRYFKEDEKGVVKMCKVMEDMRNEAAREGAKKAEELTTAGHIQNIMDSFGVTMEKAMMALKIPKSQWVYYEGFIKKQVQ